MANFAQGVFADDGAFLYYRGTTDHGWSPALAWLVAIAVPAALGVLIHLLVMARLRQASALVRVVATLALFFLALAVANEIWGDQGMPVRSPLPDTPRDFFGDRQHRRRGPVVADRHRRRGDRRPSPRCTGGRGSATPPTPPPENPIAAAALGYSPDRIAMVNWAAGGALAAVAGVLVAPILFLNVAAPRLHGAARAWRPLSWARSARSGGPSPVRSAIGVVESTLTRYIEDKGVFGPLVSPDGLLLGEVHRRVGVPVGRLPRHRGRHGRRGPVAAPRSTLLDRLPAVGRGRGRSPGLRSPSAPWGPCCSRRRTTGPCALTITMATAIVCLSLVVVTGFVGQLSLAQMALAGFGAWAAGRLATTYDWPFLFALLAGAAAAVPLGALVALPALRTRGINLAVLTFGLSVLVSEMVLDNAALTGGFDGTRPDPPEVFGVPVDALGHPGPYGLVVLVTLTVAGPRRGQRPARAGGAASPRGSGQRAGRRCARRERPAASKLYGFSLAAGIAGLGGVSCARGPSRSAPSLSPASPRSRWSSSR